MNFSNRYSRQISLPEFGIEAQLKLANAKVLVVGAGGLGVPALQYLAGMGVGTIGILDGDTINATNLHRQILYYEAEVGMFKTEIASQKLKQLNSSINIQSFNFFLTVSNALEIIQPFDLVIDATDNFGARYLLNDACVILGKPLIYGALQKFEAHLSVFNYLGGPTYRCLYPDPPLAGEIPDCNTAGVLGVVPGILGCYQALEAIKVLTGIGTPASGFVIIFDLLQNDQYDMKLKAKPENKRILSLRENYDAQSCEAIPFIDTKQLYDWLTSDKEFALLDVREQEEYTLAHLQKSLLKPLSNFSNEALFSQSNIPVVTYCQKGGRSLQAAKMVSNYNSKIQVYSLVGGFDEWLEKIGNKLVIHE